MKHLVQLQNSDRAALKYVADLERETGELFGYPIPTLPQGDEVAENDRRVFVDLPPNLGVLFRDLFQAVYPVVTGQSREAVRIESSFRDLKELLTPIAVRAIEQDRRNGLYNLFFLSLAKLSADILEGYLASPGRKPYHKFLFASHLSALLSDIHGGAMRRVEEGAPGSASFRLGPDLRSSLIETILDDPLPLVTTEGEEVQIQDVLTIASSRFVMSVEIYKELYGYLASRLRRGIEAGEAPWLREIQRLSDHPNPFSQDEVLKLLRHSSVVHFLLMDYEEVGKKVMSSKTIKANGVSYSEIGRGLLGLMEVLKKNEIIQLLKRNIEILSDRESAQAESLYDAGSLYRFAGTGRILNEVRNVTTVFLDLRGFTKTSEEAISAGDLTDQLYAIFDPITDIVKGLNGKIDKFTGDGMMITFGVESRSREDPLNALRVAIRCHETLRSLRREGKTYFQMGISIHTGVAFVSNFIAGDERVDTTVIGRNVNIAGRLSFSGDIDLYREEKKEFDDLVGSLSRSLKGDAEQNDFLGSLDSRKSLEKTISGVSVDGGGNLYNLGVVLSQQTIQAISRIVPLQSAEDHEVGYLYYRDNVLDRQVSLYYVGDAKFKGVESSFPIYAVLL